MGLGLDCVGLNGGRDKLGLDRMEGNGRLL